MFAFSLYGNLQKYNLGAIENARHISTLGQDFSSVFYCSSDTPRYILQKLSLFGAEIRTPNILRHTNGMFWRFEAAFNSDFDYLCIRDVDSRITCREICAVKDWIASGRSFHIMRDHPHHGTEILGGMWGTKNNNLLLREALMNVFEYGNLKGADQDFLRQFVYPLIKRDVFVNDSFFAFERTRNSFVKRSIENEYIGESFDEFENYNKDLRIELSKYEGSFRLKWLLRNETKIKRIFV